MNHKVTLSNGEDFQPLTEDQVTDWVPAVGNVQPNYSFLAEVIVHYIAHGSGPMRQAAAMEGACFPKREVEQNAFDQYLDEQLTVWEETVVSEFEGHDAYLFALLSLGLTSHNVVAMTLGTRKDQEHILALNAIGDFIIGHADAPEGLKLNDLEGLRRESVNKLRVSQSLTDERQHFEDNAPEPQDITDLLVALLGESLEIQPFIPNPGAPRA